MSQSELSSKKTAIKRKHNSRESSVGDEEDPLAEEFKEELREVYHQIDTSSNLLWSHDNGLVRPKRREVKRRNRDNFVCEDPYYMKLNQKADKPEEVQGFNWKTDSTAQIGYGEITKGAMLKFFNILQNIDQFFKPEHEEFMKYKKEEYRLTADDTFIDVGSGFGKPVFHAAMQVGWYSRGIEIVPARVEFCIDFVYEYEAKNKAKIEKEDKRIAKVELNKSRFSWTPLKAKRERK